MQGAASLSNVNITVPLNTKNTIDSTVITGTEADDSINNNGEYVTINALGGNDSIYNDNYYALINADTGNDSIENHAARATIDLSTGNDSVLNWSDGSSIAGGSGNDYFYTDGKETTINAGKGNDYIRNLGANVFGYAEGDGFDAIHDEGNKENATLDIYDGFYNSIRSGENIIVTVGDGKITLSNEKGYDLLKDIHINGIENVLVNRTNSTDNISIGAANYNDTVINSGSNVTVITNGGEDYISNSGNHVTIDGGKGNDFISNHNNGDYTTLSGGKGNDTIENNGDRVSISGGAGHDSIFSYSFDSTISGGAGNDTISLSSSGRNNSIQYKAGEGNDVIYGFNENSTLDIDSSNYALIPSGSDIIVRLDDGEITLKGAMNLYRINIRGMLDKPLNTNSNANNVLIFSGNYDDNISNSGQNVTILAQAGLDTVNLDWASTRTLIQYNIGDGSDLIEGFNATSTLQIGSGNETYNKAIEGDDVIITVGKEKITLKGAADLARININGVIRLITNNTKNEVELTGGRLNDSVKNSGNSVTISAAAGKDTISNSGRYVSISGGADDDFISSNKDGDFVSIDGADGSDIISVNGGFRSYIEGGKGNDSIYVPQTNDALIQYNAGDGSDYIEGFNATSTLQIGSGTDTFSKTVKSGNVIITTGEGQITLAGAASVSSLYIRGVEEIAGISTINHDLNKVIDGNEGNDTITNDANNVTISGNGGKDYIVSTGENVSINGDAGNDLIENRADLAIIDGGAGDDSISNAGDFVTISGNEGNDTINNIGNNVIFNYTFGEVSDIIYGFKENSTLNIAGANYNSAKSGDDIVITMGGGNVTLKDAAKLATVNVVHAKIENPLDVVNTKDKTLIVGTSLGDTISNRGRYVTIQAAGGNDSIFNNSTNNVLDAGAGNDSINNNYGLFTSINAGAGNDLITVTSGNKVTVNAGTGDDKIYLDRNDALLIEYNTGSGSDLITGFNEVSTLNISGSEFTSTTTGDDIIITVGDNKITLQGAATLSNPHIINGTYANFTLENSKVTYETDIPESVIKAAYQFNKNLSLFTLDLSALKDYAVAVENGADSAIKVNWNYGSASLNTDSTLEYQLDNGKNVLALTSNNYGDKITFSENATFTYGDIQTDVLKGSTISTKSDQRISFDNNSSARVEAPEDTQIDIAASNITVNDLPINSDNGAGTFTINGDGMTFEGYGVLFADLEIAKESYFGKLAAITVDYNSDDESYTIQNMACVKTLLDDFIKITFDISAAENYAYYKVNDVEFLVASDADNINVVETDGTTFNIQDKEIDAENIGRITLDEQITFSGTEINFDGVQVNYAHNKPVIYSLDGEEISISDAATLETGDDTKTFNCEAGSYVVNGRSFETSAALTFSANASEIKIPLSDAKTEIYFDGVQVSGSSGELVFDLDNDEISIPDGAIINFTSHDDIKLNLAAGNFTIDEKRISIDSELEITANKESLQVPLSENPITIRDAKITGNGSMTIDNTDALFFSILLPDGAFVENTSNNTFELAGKDSSASFGDKNKKVQLTEDGTAYIKFENENEVGVGFNTMMFEHVEIEGVDAWTVETSGTSGIDKITGITDGATVSTSTQDIDAGDLRFEVETSGAGSFTIAGQKITTTGDETYVVLGNSDGEIKVAPQGEEYADDDSETAGKVYEYPTAGNHTVNGITFHATENSKVQTITRGVEFDLSTGTFQYDGLTLSGTGTAQINRYNAKLVSLTDGAIVRSDDKSKYQNRQFEIEGAVELIGKKFETDAQIRCSLINVEDSLEFEIDGETISIPFSISGFIANDKYVQIHDDCYEGVKVVDKKLASIEGVKNSAKITGNGLANITVLTTESGEFSIHGRQYTITDDSDGVEFVTGSHGNVIEINGLEGSVEGDFTNAIRINGKAIHITGASSVKVTSDGENITEISNVAGDLVTADGNTYRKNVRVYELGGAEKLTTSADGTIIFSGNKFETSAGKTFELDEEGNVSGIEKAQSETANVSANVAELDNVAENFATINLSTTNGLEEVFGDFSEGLLVNGVLVKVTDSNNFVVKDDDESIYIETTAHDTFTINGKNFTTSADKTIFKLDASGNVCEIVTDSFYPNKKAYLIEGNFNDEIIFNGRKFCVTGTNDTSILLGDESLISIKLARNAVEVVESGGVDEIALSGAGEITVGGKTFTTSKGFAGILQTNSVENFVGTIEGELGGLNLNGTTINSEDNFSATGDGEKIIAIDNLQNGTLTSGNLDAITINGENLSVYDSDEVTLTIQDGKLKTSDETASTEEILDKLTKENPDYITISDKENISLSGSDLAIVEDTSAKVSITAGKGADTIYTAGKNVDIDLKAGGATKIFAAQGRATIDNYNAKTGAAFLTGNENIAKAIENNSIAYDDGKLNVNSARVTFAQNADSRIINFVDTAGDLQKVGFASDDSKLDASKESGSLILIGGNNSTIAGGTGHNQICLEDNSESTIILNGKNTIDNFNDDDKILIDPNSTFNTFDGENLTVKSGTARATLQNISSGDDFVKILETDTSGKVYKTAIAQEGAVITIGDELADIYVGKKSGVDFTGFENSLAVDLSENFYGINQITLGGGQNTLISSSRNETLTGNGITEFIFAKNSGRDLIQNFNFDDDKISVGNETITAVNVNSSGGVRMQISGDAILTLNDAQGKNFKINEFTALVDKNLTYNDEANYFVATSRNATLTVNEGAEIWLDGSHGKYFSGDIRTLDASTAQGKTSLVGNDSDNTIIAGNGDSSLWGGNGGDDLLVGGAGKNTFFYTGGNGNDTISGANNGDVVYLSQITLDQIASTNIAADSVAINFKDGGSLQINSAANVTYQLGDGSKFSANHEQATWIAK